MPVLLDCNFVVDAANGNGLGLRSLKGPGIRAAYMHTSATPSALNPNPANGVILVAFQDNYNRYMGGFSGQVSALGTPVTAVVNHTAYVITALGTATLAQWQAVGLPNGITPALGVGFVATASATIGGAAIAAPSATAGSGIDHIEVLGDPNATIATYASAFGPQGSQNATSYMVLQCFSAGAVTAPADGSVISLAFYMSNSSVQVQGE